MNKPFIAKQSITINVPITKVWDALVNPETIKQYMFGTEVVTDWKEGSPILYKGTWEGKAFEDKGKVIKVEPEKLLVTTHWSPLSGTADSPENYHTVRYELTADGDKTHLTLTQDNNASEEEKNHSEQNWKMMLDGLKKLLEA
jgi:uncharacterized protein YndB with AHSA1/START domain